ncbi:hypothetical protein KSF78_0006038 [Schistosoma japonicum]|nr:hypothetical protein KSF78_0006038 [Schistosoma japonicum]
MNTSNDVVVSFLNKFNELISKHCLQEALVYFEKEFSNCLKLTLAMDKAEKLKANLNLSNQSAGENEASNFQVGEEALEETLQEEDNCTFM